MLAGSPGFQPPEQLWAESAYEEVCEHFMFITYCDTSSNTSAIGKNTHFAYIFYCRIQTKGNTKKWKSSGKNSASLHQDDTHNIIFNFVFNPAFSEGTFSFYSHLVHCSMILFMSFV